MKNSLTVIFVFCISFIQVSAQLRFNQYDITSGLSQNSVVKVFKDSDGFYWIGTQDGLNKYDGHSSEIFRHNRDDKTTVSDNFITEIDEDKFGQLWVGTRHCLNRFNRHTKVFSNITRKVVGGLYAAHNHIQKIAFDKEGNLYYLAVAKLFRIKVNELKKDLPQIDTLMQYCGGNFAIDNQDTIHLLSAGCYYKCPISKIDSIESHKLFCQDKTTRCGLISVQVMSGITYVVSCDGLLKVNLITQKLDAVFKDDLKGLDVYQLYIDAQKKLWIATDKGLYLENKKENKLEKVRPNEIYPYALKSEHIISLSQTSDSLLWIGSSGHGVFIYDLKPSAIEFINRYTHPQLNSDNFSSVFYKNKKIYVGSSKGIAIFDEQFNLQQKFLEAESVSDVAVTENENIWAATSNGLFLLNKNGTPLKQINKANSALLSNRVFSILYVSKTALWVGTELGLYCYNSLSNKLNYYKSSSIQTKDYPGYILSLAKDNNGRVWVCHNFGVSVFKNNSTEYVNYQYAENNPDSLSHRLTCGFLHDNKNRTWIGTLGGGLNLFIKNKFKNYTLSDGICSDFVSSIAQGNAHEIWIGTSNGISNFDPDKNKFQNYYTSDGLVGNEVNWDAMEVLPNNILAAAGPAGLNLLNLNEISKPVKLQAPSIKKLLLDNKEVSFLSDTLIFYNNINKIVIELTSTDFRQRNNVLFEYKFEGIDGDYFRLPLGNRSLYFSNLAFGNYLLSIRALDTRGRVVSKDLKLVLRVVPPFWRTTWFLILSLISSLAIVVGLITTLVRKKQKEKIRKIEIEHKIYLERERISKDLHDNIGSQLTYIISNLDYLKYNVENEGDADLKTVIAELGLYARNTVQQLRDTIWAISGEKISVDEFSHRVKSYLVNFLSVQKNMSFEITVNGSTDSVLSPLQLLNIFRIIQEAVNNIVKHAEATSLEISFTAENKEIQVIISDDGQGFTEMKKEGHGLKNMKYRAENINGTIEILSKKNKGTQIILKTQSK